MSDTVEVDVNSTTWTSVASSGDGFITNGSKSGLFYQEAASQPADASEGHLLRSEDFIRYSLSAGQEIWGRLKSGNGQAVVTPD